MADAPAPLPTPPLNEIYGMFVGPIEQLTLARLANAAAVAASNNVTHIHLAFQSAGGLIPDGIAIYNFFKALPIPLSLYNIGSISSAGVLAFLGAGRRVATAHSTFMIHRTMSPALNLTSDRLNAMARNVILDDTRIEALYTEVKINLSADQRAVHKVADLWLSAEEAVAAKVATEIGTFAPPKGTQMFFVGSI